MDKKLEDYRRQQKRDEIWGNLKKFLNRIMFSNNNNEKKPDHTIIEESDLAHLLHKQKVAPILEEDESNIESTSEDETPLDKKQTPLAEVDSKVDYLAYITYIVYFIFWATLYAIAVELQFGTVFFMLSILFGIYFNTRTQPKRKYEVSAYSVFNENCHAIDGTLKAEQFEKEMGFRMK